MNTTAAATSAAAVDSPVIAGGLAAMTDTAIWVGCLACYTEGRLVGEWIEALHPEAAEWAPCSRPAHDEFEVMDTNHAAVRGECGVSAAIADAEAHQQMSEDAEQFGVSVGIILAWLDNMGEDRAEWAEWREEFTDRAPYTSEAWSDDAAVEEWAGEFLEETGMLSELPEWARVHESAFIEAWARDARLGGEVEVLRADDLPGFAVVIRSY